MKNSQVAVYLAYSTSREQAAIGGERDAARCQASGIPGAVRFATRSARAARMIARALDAGVLGSWMVVGDEVYGSNPHLRAELEHR
ncbi:hypothetical protein CG740_20165 [Streptomyces sp. CB01201]|nr:transposase [Streptomyces sp. CB01201]PJN01491.1 hypothetical protein CG740_20165 [Streptomyces sp. CB01201]